MATEPNTAPVETPDPAPIEAEDASLAQHEEAFPVPSRTPPPDETDAPKPSRHRARSQQAGPQDVPRIAELTKKWREAEAERDALKAERETWKARPVEPPRPVEPARVAPPAPTPVVPTGKPVLQTFLDQTADYTQAVEQYTDAFTEWKDAQREIQRQALQQHQRAEQEQTRTLTSWKTRVDAAMQEYPDFAAVAFGPTTIQSGTLIDAWILKSPAGAKLLYTLQKDPAELARIQNLRDDYGEIDAVAQAEALALLSQRLTSSPRSPAVTTGAAAAPPKPLVPRPPTPVRTAPIPQDDAPPGDDSSLADHERYWSTPRRR